MFKGFKKRIIAVVAIGCHRLAGFAALAWQSALLLRLTQGARHTDLFKGNPKR